MSRPLPATAKLKSSAGYNGTALKRCQIPGSARLGHSSVRKTADIYSHAIRGKDHAAALCWDDIMQRSRSERPTGVN